MLIETEFGNKIGGFTHYPWFGPLDWQKVNDAGRKSFVFSLSMKEKFLPLEDDQLICYRKDLGPTFGRGYDLHLSDCCNIKRDSYANFPYTYHREGKKLERNGETWKLFSGEYNFKVVEYEVFQVHNKK